MKGCCDGENCELRTEFESRGRVISLLNFLCQHVIPAKTPFRSWTLDENVNATPESNLFFPKDVLDRHKLRQREHLFNRWVCDSGRLFFADTGPFRQFSISRWARGCIRPRNLFQQQICCCSHDSHEIPRDGHSFVRRDTMISPSLQRAKKNTRRFLAKPVSMRALKFIR